MIGAVDIGGTKIAVAAAGGDGTVLFRRECLTEPQLGFPNAMLRIQKMLRQAVDACGSMQGIGIACPGPLDPFTGVIGEVGTLPGWMGCNLKEPLEREFGVSVALENDADAAALAEYGCGSGRGAASFIYITISTGIGGGIILGGHLYRGVDGSHPEVGHQILDSSGPLCYCKAHGCWESLASGTAISEWMYEQAPHRGKLSAAQICAMSALGNPLAIQAVQRQAHYLGLGLANLVTLFAPEVIALGGGVMKSSALFLDDALAVVREYCTQVPAESVRIVLASLGADVGLQGATQAWRMLHG
jgi:glucokinase